MADPAEKDQYDDSGTAPSNPKGGRAPKPDWYTKNHSSDNEKTPGPGKNREASDESPDRDTLSRVEKEAAQALPESAGLSSRSGRRESFYTPKDKLTKEQKKRARNWRFNRRRSLLGGGIIGTIVAGLLIFYSTGPLQFIHIAQLLQQFHFSANQDLSDDRFVKLARYIHYRTAGKPENVRLGILQNRVADRIESRMNKSGIQTAYTEVFGFREGYIIEPRNLAGTQYDELKDKPRAEVRAFFQQRFPGIEISNFQQDKLFIRSDSLGYFNFKNRSLTKSMLQTAGYSKVTSSIGARIMGKRAGVTWHPVRKLDNKILKTAEARYLEWKKNRARMIAQGTDVTIRSNADPRTGEDASEAERNRAAGDAASASSEADAVISEGESAKDGANSGDGDSVNKFRNSLSIRMGLGGAAVAGVACVAKGLDENAAGIKHQQVVLPLIRMGVEAVSLGNQVMSGQDVDAEQLGFYNRQLTGKDANGKKTSWNQALSIQAMQGSGNKGIAPVKTLTTINEGTPFAFLNKAPVDSILGPMCSAPAQVALTVISFFGAPITAALQTVAAAIISEVIMDDLARWLAGKAIEPLSIAGADYGNHINYGAYLAANSQAISSGGRALEPNELAQLKSLQSAESEKEFNSRSLAYRLFERRDYRSLVSKATMNIRPDFSQNAANVASLFLKPGSVIGAAANNILPKSTAATGSYDFGVPKYGFSIDEANSSLVENPYKNAEEVINNILPERPEFIDRAKVCFGVQIDPATYDVTSFEAGDPKYQDLKDGNNKCSERDSDWLQFRFYILDTQTIESAACYEGEEDACAKVGFTNSTNSELSASESSGAAGAGGTAGESIDIANLSQSSENIACDPRTRDLGTQDGYTEGKIVKIRICALPNLPSTGEESKGGFGVSGANGQAIVNSRVSGAYFSLVEAAKREGRLQRSAASSFRTMLHQQQLWADNPDPEIVAPPGYSNHQLGVAIDFYINSLSIASSQCIDVNGRCTARGYSDWEWLENNAHRYGIKPYVNEFWHWSPTGN